MGRSLLRSRRRKGPQLRGIRQAAARAEHSVGQACPLRRAGYGRQLDTAPRRHTPEVGAGWSSDHVRICAGGAPKGASLPRLRHAAAEVLRFRSCISFPPSRSIPLHAVRTAAGPGPQAAGPFLRAYPACAPAPVCARLAPARFAHLIARARQRTHFARPFPPGLFSAPAIASLCRRAKRRPRGAAPLHSSYTTFSPVKPLGGENMKIFLISCWKPNGARAGAMDGPRLPLGGGGDGFG